uniref:Uncharacterized protein n=1 Tax=Setaria italica TaxID=4555 RepID=K3ZGU5_SETIT
MYLALTACFRKGQRLSVVQRKCIRERDHWGEGGWRGEYVSVVERLLSFGRC